MYLTDVQVGLRYGISRTTVWRLRKSDRDFPQPVTLSPGCVRFKLADLEAWEAAKAKSSASPTAA